MTEKNFWFIGAAILAAMILPQGILRITTGAYAESGLEFPGPEPGAAQGSVYEDELILQNSLLSCAWTVSEGRLKPQYVRNKLTSNTIQMKDAQCFQFILEGGRVIKASDLKVLGRPKLESLEPNRESCRMAERFGGKQISVTLASSNINLEVEWRAILRNGSNYVRQEIILTAANEQIKVEEMVLLELNESNARVMGTVDGSPVVVGNMFFAYEHPLSKSQKLEGNLRGFRCSLPYIILLKPGELIVHSSVMGVVPQGQLRRAFLYYVERERAHPYRPFLHYNSWYDIGYGAEKILEHDFLNVIKLFGDELIKKRKVVINSFALDDGWDDPASLWRFHEGFPNGFSNLQKSAKEYDSNLGAWLSPFGGYGKAKQERLKYGQQQGFETNKSGFSLAGSTYYSRFRDVCTKMLREYELSYFKFDGIGVGGRPAGTNSEFARDMIALLRLISDLRRVKPDVFINITTGTWPSPFWLWYGDSIWRGGSDWSTHGWGSKRQQQITYRDKETYHNVVVRAPLHPLNSLMTQGVMFANHGLPNENEALADDIRAFFASGTDCQELYITPSLMRPQDWDALAEAAQWSRSNADVLVDTHWIGGDPAKGEIYGWASWSQRGTTQSGNSKGILALRNPLDKPATITLDIGKAFQLPAPVLPAQNTQVQVPEEAIQKYSLKSPWKKDLNKPAIVLIIGREHTFELKPFEVLVFDATPQ
ncbi:MAG: enterotoxin [Phycisphaerae bacterium]